jgi:hypothetical protein
MNLISYTAKTNDQCQPRGGMGPNRGRLVSCRGPGHPIRPGHKTERKRRVAQACRSNSNEHELWVGKSCCCQTPGSCGSHQAASIPDLEEDGKLVLSRTTSSVWNKISIQGAVLTAMIARPESLSKDCRWHHPQQNTHSLSWSLVGHPLLQAPIA